MRSSMIWKNFVTTHINEQLEKFIQTGGFGCHITQKVLDGFQNKNVLY